MSKTRRFAGAGLMTVQDVSLLHASSNPGRAGLQAVSPWLGRGGCKVSIPLRADFAIPGKYRFSLVLVPTFKASAEAIYQGHVHVC